MSTSILPGPAVDAGVGVRGLMGVGAQTFAGAKTFDATVTGPSGAMTAFKGRVGSGQFVLENADGGANSWGIWQNSGNFAMNFTAGNVTMLQLIPSTGTLASANASPFRSDAGSGSNAFQAFTAGARFKFSSSVNSDYIYSDGTNLIIPCDLSLGTNLYTTVLRGGGGAANTINLHPSAGIYLLAAASGLVTTDPRLLVRGDPTSPAKSAFSIEPQDAEPTGPNVVGDMYVTTAGVLKICTAAGTPGTWVSVGAQT